MSASREARKSEKTFDRVWSEMRHLSNCVWHGSGLLEAAEEHVDSIKRNLDETIEQIKAEASKKPDVPRPHGPIKSKANKISHEEDKISNKYTELYLVHDGNQVHLISADRWILGSAGLEFDREEHRVAHFTNFKWWKRLDADSIEPIDRNI